MNEVGFQVPQSHPTTFFRSRIDEDRGQRRMLRETVNSKAQLYRSKNELLRSLTRSVRAELGMRVAVAASKRELTGFRSRVHGIVSETNLANRRISDTT